ncbi:MAG TPA: TetR/AcrR family transcriptional regulator, partial [Cyclobacteriaceae bacterium]
MARNKNLDTWIEAGYQLFAEEGLAGIQIERLARILQLNKSSFYHYFGDLDGFYTELINLHKKRTDDFFQELKEIKTIDPDYFHLVVRYKVEVMFQMQILRNKNHKSFYQVAEQINKVQEDVFRKLWSEYLCLEDRPHLAVRYFD